MKQRYLNEITSQIIGYFTSESIGNSGEDYANVFDILDTRLGFLFDIVETSLNNEGIKDGE